MMNNTESRSRKHVLGVRIIMDSVMEEVLAFKCCSISNQNVEAHVRNKGNGPVTVPARFTLENEKGTLECNLFPPWEQTIAPGEAIAYYCSLDSRVWKQYQTLTIIDGEGGAHRFATEEITDYSSPQASHQGL